MNVTITCEAAVSAAGLVAGALAAPPSGQEASTCIAEDPILRESGIRHAFAARTAVEPGIHRAERLLGLAVAELVDKLDRALPEWRGMRVGAAIGTSSGAMAEAEALFSRLRRGEAIAAREALGATYHAPLRALDALAIDLEPFACVLTACAASTLAVGLGARWLEEGSCDLVIAGGVDALTPFVAAGFDALRATTPTPPPRPFSPSRSGLSLGEGAGLFALVRSDTKAPALASVRGFGASSDAFHLTAPSRDGDGLARAAQRALLDAERNATDVDLVSLHATATPFNDASESRALERVFGGELPRLHAPKSRIGHTLGAAGALELIMLTDALRRGIVPPTVNPDPFEPQFATAFAARTESADIRCALKLSAAFGGADAAIVLEPADRASSAAGSVTPSPSAHRIVYASAPVHVDAPWSLERIAEATGRPLERLGRIDRLTALGLSAVAQLAEVEGDLSGFGIIVGHVLATLDTNRAFWERALALGPARVEPPRFAYTTPHAVCGECSIAFGLTGPAFAVGGGGAAALEAHTVACTLVRADDARAIVVVSVDDEGPAHVAWQKAVLGGERRGGAAAWLVSTDPKRGRRVTHARSVRIAPGSRPERASVEGWGHAAVVRCRAAREWRSHGPGGSFGEVRFERW